MEARTNNKRNEEIAEVDDRPTKNTKVMPSEPECDAPLCVSEDICEQMVLAHSYVLWQSYTKAFCPSEALMKGTLFPELWGVYPIPK